MIGCGLAMPHAAPMLADASLLHSLAIGLVIAGVIILAWTFRTIFAQAFRQLFSKSARATTSPDAGADNRSRLDTAMDDAEELAQLIADRLDRQAARLEQLIAAADERLARLEQAASQPPPSLPTAPRREVADPLSRQVYDLSDRGLPSVEIARQLNQHTGKVELILALRQHS
jgi:hypothetical protein